MTFGKFIGTLGVMRGRLYDVWEVYGDPMGVEETSEQCLEDLVSP